VTPPASGVLIKKRAGEASFRERAMGAAASIGIAFLRTTHVGLVGFEVIAPLPELRSRMAQIMLLRFDP
jgi:hypothetical protein